MSAKFPKGAKQRMKTGRLNKQIICEHIKLSHYINGSFTKIS